MVSLAYARRAQGQSEGAVPAAVAGWRWPCVSPGWRCCPSVGQGCSAFLLLYGTARLLWAGVDTVRSVIWSVNYPRHLRARVTGRIMVNGSIALAALGPAARLAARARRPLVPGAILVAAAAGLAGSVAFGTSGSARSSGC
jgi:hypothetical protein